MYSSSNPSHAGYYAQLVADYYAQLVIHWSAYLTLNHEPIPPSKPPVLTEEQAAKQKQFNELCLQHAILQMI